MSGVDWEFSSKISEKDGYRDNYMHIMAYGCKLDGLQKIVEDNLEVDDKEDDIHDFGEKISYEGTMGDVEYIVTLDWGCCPTLEGGEGHHVHVRTPLYSGEDKLSPMFEKEMREYETEMTNVINGERD